MPEQTEDRGFLIKMIMLAVAVWGGLLALGALLYGIDPATGDISLSINPWRGLVVLACVGGFLGFWALMLRTQRRRGNKEVDKQ